MVSGVWRLQFRFGPRSGKFLRQRSSRIRLQDRRKTGQLSGGKWGQILIQIPLDLVTYVNTSGQKLKVISMNLVTNFDRSGHFSFQEGVELMKKAFDHIKNDDEKLDGKFYYHLGDSLDTLGRAVRTRDLTPRLLKSANPGFRPSPRPRKPAPGPSGTRFWVPWNGGFPELSNDTNIRGLGPADQKLLKLFHSRVKKYASKDHWRLYWIWHEIWKCP